MYLNKVMLIGHLGRDTETHTTQNNSRMMSFTLATTEIWRDRDTGARREKTEWHRIVVFNEHLMETVERFLRKGSKAYVEGQLNTRKWTDKEGQEHSTTEIVVNNYKGNVLALDRQEQNGQNDRQERIVRKTANDGIPF